jgi:hypothetical protein
MAGPTSNVRLECLQGIDFSETFLFFNAPASGSKEVNDLVPVDFTGATARMMVKPTSDATGTALFSLTIGSGLTWTSGTTTPGPAAPAYNNGVIVTITKALSLAANGGRATLAYYDLLVDWSNGTSALLARGTFNLAATGTR